MHIIYYLLRQKATPPASGPDNEGKENIKLNFIHCQQESATCDRKPNFFIKRDFHFIENS